MKRNGLALTRLEISPESFEYSPIPRLLLFLVVEGVAVEEVRTWLISFELHLCCVLAEVAVGVEV